MEATEKFIAALREAGLVVHDRRGELPEHPTKRFARRSVDGLMGACFHHSAMEGSDAPVVDRIARYHTSPGEHVSSDGQGCPGILYTFVGLGDGSLVVCHDLEVATWSQGDSKRKGDENREFLAVLFAGNFDSPSNRSGQHPTGGQMTAALIFWRTAAVHFGWDSGDLYGHFDFGKSACPGATLEGIIRAIRSHAPASSMAVSRRCGRQEALHALGFYTGTVDGIWGQKSKSALVSFQRASGLVADGLWGPRTESAVRARLVA